jgi:hypothetical protein
MTLHPHVPADDEPGSIIDLVEDCREVSGVLGAFAPVVVRLPDSGAVLPVHIDAGTASAFAGYGDYGS